MDGPVEHRNLSCPSCNADTVILPLFTTRRRHPVRCTNCGAQLERVLPGFPYYTLGFVTGLLLEVAVPVVLFLLIVQQWVWIAVIAAGLLLLNLGVSTFLNARTRVEFVDPADARRDKPGRWYPN